MSLLALREADGVGSLENDGSHFCVMSILKHSMRRYGFFDLTGRWISRRSWGRLARSS